MCGRNRDGEGIGMERKSGRYKSNTEFYLPKGYVFEDDFFSSYWYTLIFHEAWGIMQLTELMFLEKNNMIIEKHCYGLQFGIGWGDFTK